MEDLKARDLMSTEVITISPTATVIEAAQKMLDHRVSGLPVVDDEDRLIGVISEGDLLRRVEIGTDPGMSGSPFSLELAHEFLKAHSQDVEDVMTAKVASVLENTGHEYYPEAARQRGEQGRVGLRFRVDRSGRVLDYGVISSSGYADIDAAVEEMMRGATLPPFPADMRVPEIDVSVNIGFGLQADAATPTPPPVPQPAVPAPAVAPPPSSAATQQAIEVKFPAFTPDGVRLEKDATRPVEDGLYKLNPYLKAIGFFVSLVHVNGYRWDSVTTLRAWIFSKGFTLTCNHFDYSYEFVDHGRGYEMTAK